MADDQTNQTNGAGGDATPAPPKIRLNLAPASGSKKPESSRIDLSATEPGDIPTAAGGEALSVKDVLGKSPRTEVRPPSMASAKSQTSRVSIHDSQPIQPGEAVPVARSATSRISLRDSQNISASGAAGIPKATTSKVATDAVAKALSGSAVEDVTRQAALGRTARIMIDGPGDELPSGGSLGDTGRMTIPEELTDNRPSPKTIRIQRPSAPPKTVILKRPDGVSAVRPASQEPKTVQLKRDGAEADGGGDKGATARISVPEGALTAGPPTQRKTIRIKRSDGPPGSGAKTVIVQRPQRAELPESGDEGEVSDAAAAELSRALGVPVVDEPGIGYVLVAVLTLFILGCLVYILLAQTYMQTLPMPGRMA